MWRFELSFSKSPPAYFQGSGLGSRSSPPSLCVVPLTGFPLLLWVPTSLQPCSLSRWESQLMVALLSILPGDGSQEAEVCLSRRSSSQGGPGNCALLLPTRLHPRSRPLRWPSGDPLCPGGKVSTWHSSPSRSAQPSGPQLLLLELAWFASLPKGTAMVTLIYLLGCAGCLLLLWLFSSCCEWASYCHGFSCCGL